MITLVFVNISVGCQLFLCDIQIQHPPLLATGALSITFFLLFSSSSSFTAASLLFIFSSPQQFSVYLYVRFKSQLYPGASGRWCPTTCNCIVRIVLVKPGDDDIHVVVVWTFTPGDDWSVVSDTASVIGLDASDTFGN